MNILKNSIFLIVISMLLQGCSVSKKVQKELETNGKEEHYFKGLVVYDPLRDKTLIDLNGSKYFTPASNVKLFTFYTAYKTLGDSIAAYEYAIKGDSLILKGTADPGFLNDSLYERPVDFIKESDYKVFLTDLGIEDSPYGAGWSWDDFSYRYMPEKHRFPIYGNTVSFNRNNGSFEVIPDFFMSKISSDKSVFRRNRGSNMFFLDSTRVEFDHEIPFKTSNQLVADLLTRELGRKVTLIKDSDSLVYEKMLRCHVDSLYTKMLQDSDNFIAEQLMLIVGQKAIGSFSVKKAIEYSLETYLPDLSQKPRWVDGSGLSRYNLFTPQSQVELLTKMYKEIPKEQLFGYFPRGGESGTLKNNYQGMDYLVAKSGTLSNNYNLSGYLVTKKGKVLIFSFMNNHYQGASANRKKEMQVIFQRLHNKY